MVKNFAQPPQQQKQQAPSPNALTQHPLHACGERGSSGSRRASQMEPNYVYDERRSSQFDQVKRNAIIL